MRGMLYKDTAEREGSCQGLVAQQVGMSKGDEAPALLQVDAKRLTE